uniref:Uncharacterized protein n=1 Tax=Kalanchoe fedtschenkoi TaxID=63787 RepID=A0A7N0TPZ9_KALFE
MPTLTLRTWAHDNGPRAQPGPSYHVTLSSPSPQLLRSDQGWGRSRHDSWNKVAQVRDKFEYDREKRMREKAFAPMNGGPMNGGGDVYPSHHTAPQNQPFDTRRYFSEPDSESE